MRLFSFDPGTRSAGWALFEDGLLSKAGLVTASHIDNRWQRTRKIIKELLDLGILEVDTLVSEEPVFRGAACVAFNRMIGAMEFLREDPIVYYKPTAIKKCMGAGTLSKEDLAAQVVTLLSETELEVIKPYLNQHDVTDAIAIGLTALGRHCKKFKEEQREKRPKEPDLWRN